MRQISLGLSGKIAISLIISIVLLQITHSALRVYAENTPTPDTTTTPVTSPAPSLTTEPKNPEWELNFNGTVAVTTQPVAIGVTYKLPQDNKLTITFSKLPSVTSNLTITQISLSADQIKQLGAVGPTAYDVSTGMPDGSFTYDLTLPLPDNQPTATVKYAETIAGLAQAKTVEQPVSQLDNAVKVSGLDHFTVFVVVNPASSGNNNSVGAKAWSNPGNVYASDDIRATVTLNNSVSEYLTASNFAVGIPGNAIVEGIKVEVERRTSNNNLVRIQDNSVKIIKNGSIDGSEHALAADWPNSDAVQTYGSETDLWGLSWTAADVNAADFGVAISVQRAASTINQTAGIDYIHIFVYYNTPPEITVTAPNGGEDFAGGSIHNITWTAADTDAGAILSVDLAYSSDGTNWDTITSGLANTGTYSWTVPALDSSTVQIKATVSDSQAATSDQSDAVFSIDSTAPALIEITPVATPTNNPNPTYTFSSNEAGTITYSGNCSSTETTASNGNTTINLNTLGDGIYSICTLTVTDPVGNVSSPLHMTTFTIDTAAPVLTEILPIVTPGNDNTPDYTFSSSEAGNLTYSGDCSSTNISAVAGNNTITFNTLADGDHSNCTVTLTDLAGNGSNTLDVPVFQIDTVLPVLSEVVPVLTLSNNNTPVYIFKSTKAGTIAYTGDCSSTTSSAVNGFNTITLATLTDGLHNNCTLTVTDVLGNLSDPLNISDFNIDTVAPALAEVTAVLTPGNDTTPTYTFSSDEPGTIAYSGDCSSVATAGISGSNSVIFAALADGPHNNCTITVTDAANNTSSILSVSPFTIDTIAPIISADFSGTINDGQYLTIDVDIEDSGSNVANSTYAIIDNSQTTVLSGAIDDGFFNPGDPAETCSVYSGVSGSYGYSNCVKPDKAVDISLLASGFYDVRICASDTAGNIATGDSQSLPTGPANSCYRYSVTIDTAAPGATSVSNQTFNEGDSLTSLQGVTGTDNMEIFGLCWELSGPYSDNSCDFSGSGASTDFSLNPFNIAAVDTSVIPEGTYTINYFVLDSADNRSDSNPEQEGDQDYTTTITILNVPPRVSFGDNQTLVEGTAADFSGSFSDPSCMPDGTAPCLNQDGNQPDDAYWGATVDYGDGSSTLTLPDSPYFEPTDLVIPSHTYAHDGTFTAVLSVCESSQQLKPMVIGAEGYCTSQTTTISVSNLPPSVSINGTPGNSVAPGTVIQLMAVVDSGNAPFTYSWSGACTGSDISAAALSTSGSHTCQVVVTDIDGDQAAASASYTVASNGNVPTVHPTYPVSTPTVITPTPSDTPTPTPTPSLTPTGAVQGETTSNPTPTPTPTNSDTSQPAQSNGTIILAGIVFLIIAGGVALVLSRGRQQPQLPGASDFD